MRQKITLLILFYFLLCAVSYGQPEYTVESFNPYPAECQQSNIRCEVALGEVSNGGQIVLNIRKFHLDTPNDPHAQCGYSAFFSLSPQGSVRLTSWKRYHPATYTFICGIAQPYTEVNMDAVDESFMLDNADADVYTYSNGQLSSFWKFLVVECPDTSCILFAHARSDSNITIYNQIFRFVGGDRRIIVGNSPVEGYTPGKSRAFDINSSGSFVGTDTGLTNSPLTRKAIIRNPGSVIRDLNTVLPTQNFPGFLYTANRINNRGRIWGFYTTEASPSSTDGKAFFWNGSNLIAVPSLPPNREYSIYSLNDSDKVVATVTDENNPQFLTNEAVIWDEDNGRRRLDSLLDPNSGITLHEAYDISNNGNIVARGRDSNGQEKIYLLMKPREPLIFIPGIMGSQMVGSYLGVTTSYFPNIIPSNNCNVPTVRNLTLDVNDPCYKPGIYANDVLTTALSFPVYKPLLDFLKNKGNVTYDVSVKSPDKGECDINQKRNSPRLNPSLFVFPYDWRQDNNISAQKLKTYVQCVQQFYSPGTKVNIIAHSQGGLVARRYILQQKAAGQPHGLDKVVTVASPFLGAPEALFKLYTGGNHEFPFSDVIVSPQTIRFLAPHFPAIHQLMPSRTYQRLRGGILAELNDVNGNGVRREVYQYGQLVAQVNTDFADANTYPGTTSADFHDFGGQDDWTSDNSGIQYFHIFGEQKQLRTNDGIYFLKHTRCRNRTSSGQEKEGCFRGKWYIPVKGPGDKTVPRVSTAMGWTGEYQGQPRLNLAPPTMQIFFYESQNESRAEEELAEHNGITKNVKIQNLISYLLDYDSTFLPVAGVHELPRPTNLTSQEGVEDNIIHTGFPGIDLSRYEPTYYLTIGGQSSVLVRDQNGNTAAIEDGLLRNDVPGLFDYESIGEESVMLTFSRNDSYTVEFRTGATPADIELVYGRGNRNPNTAVRYRDLTLPPNSSVQLTFSQKTVTNLKYDADDDGEFETVIPAAAVLSGTSARDITAPDVTIDIVRQGTSAIATINAEDTESGVSKIWYSIDGQIFRLYDSPIIIPHSTNPIKIEVFADDVAANRSSLFTKILTFDTTVVPLAECISSVNGVNTAWFGYENQNSSAMSIPAGIDNYFLPLPGNRGQTFEFQPGIVNRAFSIAMLGKRLDWKLRGTDGVMRTATVTLANTPRCQ